MRYLALALIAFFLGFVSLQANPSQEIKSMNVKRITPGPARQGNRACRPLLGRSSWFRENHRGP